MDYFLFSENNIFTAYYTQMGILFAYFLLLNAIAFAVAGYDKYRAVNNKFRIPEKTLFTLAFFGGSVGLLLAMMIFRHKISKASFLLKFSVIIIVQLALLFGFDKFQA